MSDTKKPEFHPEVEALLNRLPSKSPDSATLTSLQERASPDLKRAEMFKLNKPKLVTDEEREAVKSDFERMTPRYPNKTKCYQAIAIERDIDVGRVRYIVEGPRRKKG